MSAHLPVKLTLESPQFFDDLTAHVANGGCPIEFSELHHIPWGRVSNWIRRDKERERLFDAAEKDREQYLKRTILRNLDRITNVDLRDAYDDDGNLLPIKQIPRHVVDAIQSIESEELWGGTGRERGVVGDLRRVKFLDKTKALDLLGKYLKLFDQTHKHKVEVSFENFIKGSYAPSEIAAVQDTPAAPAVEITQAEETLPAVSEIVTPVVVENAPGVISE